MKTVFVVGIGYNNQTQISVVATILNHYLLMKEALLLNLDYKGSNKSLIRLNQLISKVDGVSIFGTNLTTRLTNVFTNN